MGRAVVGFLVLAGVALAAGPGRQSDTVAGLAERLQDEDAVVRLRAARDLGNLGAAARQAVPALARALHDPVADVRLRAGGALAQVGEAAVPELTRALKAGEVAARRRAARALVRVGPEAAAAVPALGEALKDRDLTVRVLAALALGEVGEKALPAAADLLQAVNDPDAAVRDQATEALARLGPAAVPALTAALGDGRPEVRSGAATALGRMRPEAAAAVPALAAALADKDDGVRQAVALALAEIGPKAEPAARDLVAALANEKTRAAAAHALVKIGAGAVPELRRALKNGNGTLQLCASLTLARIGPRARASADALADLLTDRLPAIRAAAATALGQIGPPARAATPALKQALLDAETEVRLAAAFALARVQPNDPAAARQALALATEPVLKNVKVQAATFGLDPQRLALFAQMMDHSFNPRREVQFDNIVTLYVLTSGRDVSTPPGNLLRFVVQHLPADSVFALVRGVAKAPARSGGLAQRLEELVRGLHDPYLLCYLLLYVERNRPRALAPPGGDRLQAVETTIINQLQSLRYQSVTLSLPVLTPQLNRNELQRQQQLWAELVRQQLLEEQEQLRRMLAQESPEALRGRLADDHPDVRAAAVQVIGRKRLHLETELIERLDDRDPEVRQAARQALARLARGTDFGPAPAATRAERLRAMQRWRNWLVLQGAPGGDAPGGRGSGPGVKKAGGVDPRRAMKLLLEGGGPTTLRTEDARVAELSTELVVAKGERQEEVLTRLRDARGVLHTEALALAIPRLDGEVRAKARDALAERLARMTARTLRDKFGDEDAEVRAAAARACARKAAREHLPDLLRLLEDPEVPVIQAARSALAELTGEDFGPARDANRTERLLSVAAWHGWWHKQQAVGK